MQHGRETRGTVHCTCIQGRETRGNVYCTCIHSRGTRGNVQCTSIEQKVHSLKYLRYTTKGCNDIGVRKSEFVEKTQFL